MKKVTILYTMLCVWFAALPVQADQVQCLNHAVQTAKNVVANYKLEAAIASVKSAVKKAQAAGFNKDKYISAQEEIIRMAHENDVIRSRIAERVEHPLLGMTTDQLVEAATSIQRNERLMALLTQQSEASLAILKKTAQANNMKWLKREISTETITPQGPGVLVDLSDGKIVEFRRTFSNGVCNLGPETMDQAYVYYIADRGVYSATFVKKDAIDPSRPGDDFCHRVAFPRLVVSLIDGAPACEGQSLDDYRGIFIGE